MPRALILFAAAFSAIACGQAVTPDDAAADHAIDGGDRNFDCVNDHFRRCDVGHVCVITACDGGLRGACMPPRAGCAADDCDGGSECPCTECDRMLCEDPAFCFNRSDGHPFVNCHPE